MRVQTRLTRSLTFKAHCQERRATSRRMPSDEAFGRYDHRGTLRTLFRAGPPVLLHCGESTSPVKCVPRRARSASLQPSARRGPACSCGLPGRRTCGRTPDWRLSGGSAEAVRRLARGRRSSSRFVPYPSSWPRPGLHGDTFRPPLPELARRSFARRRATIPAQEPRAQQAYALVRDDGPPGRAR